VVRRGWARGYGWANAARCGASGVALQNMI